LVKAGKRKCLSAEQALGKHAQLLKPSFVRKIRKIEKRGRFRRLKSLEELWE
jgi:DNA-binding MarR family transcriptional regulator